MMSRAEVRRSLLAMGVHPRVVDSIVSGLPAAPSVRHSERGGTRRVDEADVAAASVIADCERLLTDDDAS
jgi:hypothetical protein